LEKGLWRPASPPIIGAFELPFVGGGVKLTMYGAIAAVFAVLTGAPAQATEIAGSNYSGWCGVDDEAPAQERAAAEQAAMALFKAMSAGDNEATWNGLAGEAQASATRADYDGFVKVVQGMGPFDYVRVAHTYFLKVKGEGQFPPAICGKSVSGGDWVAVAQRPLPMQAHVEIAAHSINNDWSFVAWMVPDGSGWRALSIYVNASAASGRTSTDFLRLAREQKARGHLFNAALLYAGARSLTDRGPNFQLGLLQDIQEDLATFQAPPELSGPAPFTWTFEGRAYEVSQVTTMGVGGKLVLLMKRRAPAWPGDKAVDAESRTFIEGFIKAHPEYGEVFGAIVVQAVKPDGSGGYGTVYENGKGFA
jgi:hypothetical protein